MHVHKHTRPQIEFCAADPDAVVHWSLHLNRADEVPGMNGALEASYYNFKPSSSSSVPAICRQYFITSHECFFPHPLRCISSFRRSVPRNLCRRNAAKGAMSQPWNIRSEVSTALTFQLVNFRCVAQLATSRPQ
jgi:hypothetical protein